jgi:hypothetical protein
MKSALLALILATPLAAGGCMSAAAQPTPVAAPAAKVHAQVLVDQALARHPELKILAMHVTPPGQAQNVIIASNIGRIGKVADADDLSVIASGAPRMEVTRTGYSVELVMRDAAHRPIGVLGITFAYAAGDDTAPFLKRAEAVRDELGASIPDLTSLFAPAS